MTGITFLASSKPFMLPPEIEAYNRKIIFEKEEDHLFFAVEKADEFWCKTIQPLFSMPYIYEAEGIGNRLFLLYLERYMEYGEVIEICHIPNQHAYLNYIDKFKENPTTIEVNTVRFTYRDASGCYQLNSRTWIEELSHRNYNSPHSVTRFVKF